ncbi:GNAT family N-acetyltransferase [Angustibacter luteus]|uniref:GNAT family N-acetyltransferase n=1 Tax=Angustibacter luteus TaxID=658456 RepID=A0ABW1JK90_9ACTN
MHAETAEISWFTGPREDLRPMFELAEDSALQLDAYLPLGRVLVAVVDGVVVGHLQLVDGDRSDVLELKSLAVVESFRGNGIGRALVERAVAECRSQASRTLMVSTAAAGTDNLRFYQRRGFRMLSVERDAFTASTGYPDPIDIDGIPLRDRVWLSMDL